jgi:hypothetical protein
MSSRFRILCGWFCQWLIAFLVAVPTVAWIISDVPPTQVHGIYAIPRFVPPGGDLHLRFIGVRNRACPVVSTEEIIDSSGRSFRIPSRLGNPARETGPFDISIHTQVPLEASKGLAIFRTVGSYGVDPFRGCFRSYIIGPPARPEVRFWIGSRPPWAEEWMQGENRDGPPPAAKAP